MRDKPRIAVLADWFAPGFKAGGPTRSCVNFVRFFEEAYEIYVFTTDTDFGAEQPYAEIPADEWVAFSEHTQVYYFSKARLSYGELFAQLMCVQPDFLYINSMFSLPFTIWPLWMVYRKRLISQAVLAPRGMLKSSALAFKSFKKKPFLWLMKGLGIAKHLRFHATNDAEKAEIAAVFGRSDTQVAVNLPKINQATWQSLPKVAGELKVIFLARVHPIKNLAFLLKALAKVPAAYRISLSIVGPMEDAAYWEQCQQVLKALATHLSVEYKGAIPYEETADALAAHHLMALPTHGENFGHAIFDSLSAGRPVLISDQTPWKDLASVQAGWEISLSDREAFTAALVSMAAMDQQSYDQWSRASWQYARNFIETTPLKQQYQAIFS